MPRVSAAHERELRTRIVAAALQVFGERGYHRATIADIVRESGLSVGAIYTYFRGKDEIYLATCDLSAGRGLGELADRVAAGRTTAERLAIAIAFFLDSVEPIEGEPDMASFLVGAWAQAEAEPAVREMLLRRREQLETAGQLLVREGIARGELPAWLDADGLTRGFISLLDGLLLQRIEAGAAWDRTESERRAKAVLEAVVAATAAPERPHIPVVPARPYSIVDKLDPAPPARASARTA